MAAREGERVLRYPIAPFYNSGVIRVLLAEDHATVREGLRLLLDGQSDMEVVGEACDGMEAIELATLCTPLSAQSIELVRAKLLDIAAAIAVRSRP